MKRKCTSETCCFFSLLFVFLVYLGAMASVMIAYAGEPIRRNELSVNRSRRGRKSARNGRNDRSRLDPEFLSLQ